MRWAKLRSFCRSVLRRSQMEDALSEELQFHLECRAADLAKQRRLTPQEAMRLARIEFGSTEKYKEEARQSLGLRLVDEFRADLRYAWRTMRANKGFTAAAVATLTLGIGANTAVFSVTDALLLRPLPVEDPEALVVFDWLRTPDSMVAGYSGYGRPAAVPGTTVRTAFSSLTFERFRARTDAFADVFAFSRVGRLNIDADGRADLATALLVSGRYFAGLGVRPAIGRAIESSDDTPAAQPVGVISHRYWQARFAGDPSIVGKIIRVNRVPVVVIGVAPPGFDGVRKSESTDITLPIVMAPRLGGDAGRPWTTATWWMEIMGRLRPGVTREQALAGVHQGFRDTVRESWAARPANTPNPSRTGMPQLRIHPGARGPDGPRVDAQQVLSLAFAVVGAVLLIGCVNLANLLFVKGAARQREIAVRLSLGASRSRVVRQMLTESLMLALIGGIGGAIVAVWAKEFMSWLPTGEAPVVDARIDPRVLAFAAMLSVLTVLVFSIGPTLRVTRRPPRPWLTVRSGRITRGLTIKSLLVLQVAVSLVLLAGAGLLVRTLYNFSQVDVGFDTDRLLVFRINPATADPSRATDLSERVIAAVERVPGVRSATISVLPLVAGHEWDGPVVPDGETQEATAFIQAVRWNFLDTIGLPLLAGRGLTAADVAGRPRVAIVNDAMARGIFRDPNPIGRRFQFASGPYSNVSIEVVGVVRDAKYSSLSQQPPPTLFVPYAQLPFALPALTIEVRTASDPLALAPAIRSAVRQVDAGLPLIGLKTQDQQIAETIGRPRALAVLTFVAGLIGLVLASVGLYGTVSYDAVQRTNEIGIRMALGAQRSDVLRLVMRQTMIVVTVGAVVGFGAARAASQAVSGLLFGVTPGDPLAIGAAACVLLIVAFVAGYIPARRAARLDPTAALRYE